MRGNLGKNITGKGSGKVRTEHVFKPQGRTFYATSYINISITDPFSYLKCTWISILHGIHQQKDAVYNIFFNAQYFEPFTRTFTK
jgi:hypothetical protein